MDLCPHKITIPKVLGPPEITFYQENTPAFSFPTKQRPYCGNVAALPTIPTPSAPSPQVLSQLSAAQPHPHLGMRGGVLGCCSTVAPGVVHRRHGPGPGAGRNLNKPTEANPRDILLWCLILTLTLPNRGLFSTRGAPLTTYQETSLRPAFCHPPSFRPHSACISAPTQVEKKSLLGE